MRNLYVTYSENEFLQPMVAEISWTKNVIIMDKCNDSEDIVVREGQPVYLTKNGHGSMVVLSLERYAELIDDVELKLDEADKEAETTDIRHTHDEVFSRLRARINVRK